MPFVEVWVEPEVDQKQTAAIKAIVRVCRDVASSGVLPSHDSDALDKLVRMILEEFPQDISDDKDVFPADKAYRRWKKGRDSGATQ